MSEAFNCQLQRTVRTIEHDNCRISAAVSDNHQNCSSEVRCVFVELGMLILYLYWLHNDNTAQRPQLSPVLVLKIPLVF